MSSYSLLKKQVSDKDIKVLVKDKTDKLRTVDYKVAVNRQFLTRTFRELDKLIDKPRKFCNPSLTKMLGYSQKDILQQDQQQVKNSQENEISSQSFKKNAESKKQGSDQRKDKKVFNHGELVDSNGKDKSSKKGSREQKDSKKQKNQKENQAHFNQVDFNLIDCILDHSRKIQPYMVSDFSPKEDQKTQDYQFSQFSDMANASYTYNRECPEPKVKIDGQIVFQFQHPNSNRIKNDDFVYTCYKSASFLLVVEVMPGNYLQLTKNGKTPLLSPQHQCFGGKSYEQKLNPPCVINCVAISPKWKLPSRNLTIIVKKNVKNGEQQIKNKQISGMMRPYNSVYDYLQDSRSNASASGSSSLWH